MKAVLSLLAVALFAIGTIHAQTVTGTVETHSCGRVSTPTYCYGIPITLAGVSENVWVYQQSSGAGFVDFLTGGLGQATITSPFQPLNGAPLVYAFTGSGYSGQLVLTYSKHYSSGGGGRGGGGAGWYWTVTGGTITIN